MEQKVLRTITKRQMIQKGDGVVLGVSGGADSVCLLLLLYRLREAYELRIWVVHVEHGIRGEESLRDAAFVKSLCGRLEVPFYLEQVDVPSFAAEHRLGLEEAARICRYRVLQEQAKLLEQRTGVPVKIALGHNANDNAETILFHMIRGSGIRGLRGIPVERDRIIRPMLDVTRKEIEEYLGELGEDFCTDSTNLLDEYQRNTLRHQVLPVLEKMNNRAVEHISQSAAYLEEAEGYIRGEVERISLSVTEEKGLNRRRLSECDPFLQKEVLCAWIRQYVPGAKDITAEHIRSLQRLLTGKVGKQVCLPGVTVTADYEHLAVQPPSSSPAVRSDGKVLGRIETEGLCAGEGGELCVRGRRVCYTLESREKIQIFPAKNYTKWLDCANIKGSLVFRTRQTGDFLVVNSQGGSKKLKDYFIDEKIPRRERDEVLLLCHGHHVLWVVGHRISEDVKVTDKSDKALKVQIMEEENHE